MGGGAARGGGVGGAWVGGASMLSQEGGAACRRGFWQSSLQVAVSQHGVSTNRVRSAEGLKCAV